VPDEGDQYTGLYCRYINPVAHISYGSYSLPRDTTNLTLLDHLLENLQLLQLEPGLHGLPRMIPITHDRPLSKVLLLLFHCPGSQVSRSLTDLHCTRLGIHILLLRLQGFQFNGQAMTVPAWNIVYSFSLAELEATEDIFQDFVQSMSGMKTAVGIWWAIMEDKWRRRRTMVTLPGVEVIGALFDV
jgi:hypothetical protein